MIEKGKQLEAGMSEKDSAAEANSLNLYPPPMAKYEEVVADRELFIKSLEKLHATLGTKFMWVLLFIQDQHLIFLDCTLCNFFSLLGFQR